HRDAAGLLDQAANFGDGQLLRRVGAGVVVDLLVNDGAVEVVGPEAQRHLRRLDAEHDPVRLDVREVVEHQPADRHRLQVHQPTRLGNVRQPGVVGMERQRDERLKAAGLVLQFTQADQVVDAVAGFFDVAVEHGGVGAQAELVRLAVDANPRVGVGLVFADLVAYLGVEDLGAAAGQAAEAGVFKLGEDVARRLAGQPREPVPFDGGVGFQVEPRVGLVDDADDVEIPLVGQQVVQAADDVQLGGAAALGLGGALEDLFVGHDVTLRTFQVGPKGAEGAAVNADVGRVEVGVDVVIGEVAVFALAHLVGEFAEGEQVGRLVEVNAVVEREALAGVDFFANDGEAGGGARRGRGWPRAGP